MHAIGREKTPNGHENRVKNVKVKNDQNHPKN